MSWILANRRLIGIGAVLLALAIFAGFVHNWREGYKESKTLKIELDQERANAAERERIRGEQDRITREMATDYETKLAKLKADNAALGNRPVRLCKPASVPQVPRAAAVVNDPAPEPIQQAVSRDIGPSLFRLAGEADECAVRLIALQAWVTEQMAVR